MISKHIKHKLNIEGKSFFTEKWLPKLKKAQQSSLGFYSILVGEQIDDLDNIHLILQFSDQAALDNWSKNTTHLDLLKELKLYQIDTSEINLFQLKEI